MEKKIPQHIQEQIHNLLDSKLDERQTEALWADMVMNPTYIEYMKTVGAFKHLGKEHANEDERPDTKKSILRVYLSAAAILLIIGLLGIFYLIAPTHPVLLSPIGTIELDNIRSAEQYTGFNHQLQTAIAHLVKGEEEQALAIIYQIRENPEMADSKGEAIMLSGIIHYNNQSYESALIDFMLVADHTSTSRLAKEEALWFAANSLLHLNQTEEAEKTLQKVIEMDGAYSRIANKLMNN